MPLIEAEPIDELFRQKDLWLLIQVYLTDELLCPQYRRQAILACSPTRSSSGGHYLWWVLRSI